MTTWHQQQALTRHFQECRDKRVPLTNPYAHPTRWRVIEDPPNGATSCSSWDTRAQAMAELSRGPHRFLVPPTGTPH